MTLRAIKYEDKSLEILDQLLLPAQSKFIKINGVEDGWKVINKMQVCKILCKMVTSVNYVTFFFQVCEVVIMYFLFRCEVHLLLRLSDASA